MQADAQFAGVSLSLQCMVQLGFSAASQAQPNIETSLPSIIMDANPSYHSKENKNTGPETLSVQPIHVTGDSAALFTVDRDKVDLLSLTSSDITVTYGKTATAVKYNVFLVIAHNAVGSPTVILLGKIGWPRIPALSEMWLTITRTEIRRPSMQCGLIHS